MKEKIYSSLPHFIQNIFVSIFNILAYNKLYGGNYKYYLNTFLENRSLSYEELETKQAEKYKD